MAKRFDMQLGEFTPHTFTKKQEVHHPMPANVQTMFSVEEIPWHRQGKVLAEAPQDAAAAITAAGLDWQVHRNLISNTNGKTIPGYYAITRTDTGQTLGVVKGRYTPLQNKDAFAFFDPLLQRKYASCETAGALGEGEIVWIQCLIKHQSSFRVVGDDEIKKYLLLSNSHDGSSGVNIKFTPIRVVCQNTLNYALSRGQATIIKHLPSMPGKLKEKASQYEAMIDSIYGEIEDLYKLMAGKKVDVKTTNRYFETIFPITPDSRDLTAHQRNQNARHNTTVKSLLKHLETSRTLQLKGVHGTLWGAYNAVTEHMDHPANYQKGPGSLLKRIWFGKGDQIKRKALAMAVQELKSA